MYARPGLNEKGDGGVKEIDERTSNTEGTGYRRNKVYCNVYSKYTDRFIFKVSKVVQTEE